MENDEALRREGSYELVGDRVRIFQRGKTWYANYQHAGRQHRESLKTTSKKEAVRRARQIDCKLVEGRWEPEVVAATIEETAAAYVDFLHAEGRAAKTLRKYEFVLGLVKQVAADRGVESMESLDLRFHDAYRKQRVHHYRAEQKISLKTQYNESTIIRCFVNFALLRGMITNDPLKGLKLVKPKPTPQPCWKHADLQGILEACPDDIKPALILLGETGMRFGELQWLTWDDVDLESGHLRVRPKEGWKPKSGDERTIPISAVMRTVLKRLPRRWRWVVTMPPSPTVAQAGRPWTERRLLGALKRVLKKLKLPGKLHTFRHTFISNALLKGIPVAVVQEWVGHVDAAIIKLYTHVHNEASQAAMQRLNEANNPLQKEGKEDHGRKNTSAQNQHTDKRGTNAQDANS